MSLTAPLRRHRTRSLPFVSVLILVASLGAASEDFSDLKKRAKKGNTDAQFKLGVMYDIGLGVSQDFAMIVTWWRKAEEQGLAPAQEFLNTQISSENLQEKGNEFNQLKIRAKQGDAMAQYNLGVLYAEGETIPQNFSEARKWSLEAAEQGFAPAQYNLGVLYRDGQGMPQDYPEMLRWFRMAAERGFAPAQYNLGVMYARGQRRVPRDFTEARKWYRKAAEQGLAEAQYELGVMYDFSVRMPQDSAKAREWFLMAAEQGFADAQNFLSKME